MTIQKIKLQRVQLMPKELEAGVLYVSEEYEIAVHLCACGCGAKIRTPLGPTEWTFEDTSAGPSLDPSIGNWQQKCQSHYWVYRGEISWARQWTKEQIIAGREREEERRRGYYEEMYKDKGGLLSRLYRWFISSFK